MDVNGIRNAVFLVLVDVCRLTVWQCCSGRKAKIAY